MAAFRFIPGVSSLAVEAATHILDGTQSFVHHAGIDELSRDQVFDAGPRFGVIREWNFGSSALSVIAKQNCRLVVQRINALDGIMLEKRFPIVVFLNGFESCSNVPRINQETEIRDVSQILADKLIGQT